MKKIVFLLIPLILLVAACDAATNDSNQTYNNQQQITNNLPIPSMSYSQRRWVLLEYYAQVLNKPRLRTCTMVTSRGSGGSDVIGIAETLGMPVNLTNNVTGAGTPEPDNVYTGPNDQTVFVLRNGRAIVTEADTTAVTGDCPPGVKPKTVMQQVIDYQESQPPVSVNDPNGVNFCAESHC